MSCISDKECRARRSIGTRRLSEGVTSLDKPFYISKDGRSSIYNDTEPKERHFTGMEEVDTIHFVRGESFSGCFYDEGCDHSRSFVEYDIMNNS